MKKYINSLKSQSQKIFLIDAAGALLSAVMLGLVLTSIDTLIGLPQNTLFLLAGIPILFVVYDLIAYKYSNNQWRWYLKGIAICNVLYAIVSAALLINHRSSLTALGWTYFIVELIIVLGLAIIEYKIASESES